MLDAPVMRAASLDMPYPFSTILEEYMVLNSAKVEATLRKLAEF